MDEYPLKREQTEYFQKNGFIQLDNVLTPDELEIIRRGVDEVWSQKRTAEEPGSGVDPEYAKVFVQMVNMWRINQDVRDHVMSSKIARIARELSGASAIRLWHDHALIKTPGNSKPSAWHQDLPYWPHHQSNSLSCWMALDDVSIENGCMSFIPESHSWGKFEPIRLGDPQDLFDLVQDRDTKDLTPVPQPMKAGSCTFHHGLMFHYAGPNTADKPRRAMITIYMADGTTYDGKPHIVTDGLGLNEGDKLEGELFPVLA